MKYKNRLFAVFHAVYRVCYRSVISTIVKNWNSFSAMMMILLLRLHAAANQSLCLELIRFSIYFCCSLFFTACCNSNAFW